MRLLDRGHLSGVAKLIKDAQPKAVLTKFYAHSLSLSVKNATKQCKIPSDVMCATKEIIALIKFSPKSEKILGDIKTNMLDKAKEHSISGSELPRKRRVPKRFEEGSSQWSHPAESPEDYYRQIYFEVIDNVTELIKSYFNQPELLHLSCFIAFK